jgi:hypothetical protein
MAWGDMMYCALSTVSSLFRAFVAMAMSLGGVSLSSSSATIVMFLPKMPPWALTCSAA